MSRRTNRKWTREEENRVIRQIEAFPQNLTRCFFMVAEEVDRTPSAVASHWYTKISKRPEVMCFFTASRQHVSKNRKNGLGARSSRSIWHRLVSIIRGL